MPRAPRQKKAAVLNDGPDARPYVHPEATVLSRPEAGTQAQFRKRKAPAKYRYDDSLAPELIWDAQNAGREPAEAELAANLESLTAAEKEAAELKDLLAKDGKDLPAETRKKLEAHLAQFTAHLHVARSAGRRLKSMSGPFLNWSGKAERVSFDVPTLPLFVHERLSTRAIIESLKHHERSSPQLDFLDGLFADPRRSVVDQSLRAYEFPDKWVNRLVLGDSLLTMNSLLHFERMAGKVQMVFMDPPYGVKFGSNFQPFVRKRDVKHNEDDDFTREPEMVQAYRDTWELGLHSYLTYLRDRLLLSRELLTSSGSVFVQISDENLHHVREIMDEVFGAENFVSVITVKKTTSASSELLPTVGDFLLWYSREKKQIKYSQPYFLKLAGVAGAGQYNYVEESNGNRRPLRKDETFDEAAEVGRLFCHDNLTSQRPPGDFPVEFNGQEFRPRKGYWKTGPEGMAKLRAAKRFMLVGNTLRYVRYLTDFPVFPATNIWDDTVTSGFDDPKAYVVQTNTKIVERCILMTTDPGDLVLDPTCGSGTTAYVSEQWGRRWITCDTSRVPLALARQRLLTATFPWYDLKEESRGPAGGFVYRRKQNKKGEEVGGIVPHVTLKSIANDERPKDEVLVDRPEENSGWVRVTGPFTVEATIPTPVDLDGDGESESPEAQEEHATFTERMLEILRRSPVLRLPGNRVVELKNVRAPAKTLSLSAEAVQVNGSDKPVAFVFGPEHGAVSERLVFEAAKEANMKSYSHLYVIGFAFEAQARKLIANLADGMGIPATEVTATPDLLMGDLLKNMRSSQIFSVCGAPEIKVRSGQWIVDSEGKQVPFSGVHRPGTITKVARKGPTTNHEPPTTLFQVELLGLDVFDPVQMTSENRRGDDVPAWFLDHDYNGTCFRVCQAFFPRTGAWEKLKKALKATHEPEVWDHLAGTLSAPFDKSRPAQQVAVKVIDDRGNELMVVRELKEENQS